MGRQVARGYPAGPLVLREVVVQVSGVFDSELADELARLADESIAREERGELVSVVRPDGSVVLVTPEVASARAAALDEAAALARARMEEFTASRVESGSAVEPEHMAAMEGMVLALEGLAQAARGAA